MNIEELEGGEAVLPDETVLRRVLDSYLEGPCKDRISPKAFRPRATKDAHGLSLVREKYATPRRVACRPPPVTYVAALRVEELVEAGLSVQPDPDPPDNPGHCLIPELRSDNRMDAKCREWQELLAFRLSTRLGPFFCPASDRAG